MLIVGAGAAGGYLGAQLINAGRDITFLVHEHTLQRLASDGLRIRYGTAVYTTDVNAVTAAELDSCYDVVVLAVRTNAVAAAIEDVRRAVGRDTRIVPLMNGLHHLSLLAEAFGPDRPLGAATRLVASSAPDGTIDVVTPGIDMRIGQLDGARSAALDRTAAELDVPNVTVHTDGDILAAMWEKFAFIASTAALTCLVGDEIGPIARSDGGIALARSVLQEVAAVAAADGHALGMDALNQLDAVLTDRGSTFGPSMFRDLHAGRTVEITVLEDLADRARTHGVSTPLLDASMVRVDLHNRRLGAR